MTGSRRGFDRRLGCLVLAAGGSERLGTPKQLLRYRGRPLLALAIDAAAKATSAKPAVVLGAEALRLRLLLRRAGNTSQVVYNADWRRGLAGSLRAGIDSLAPGTGAVLIVLTDQPLVGAVSLARLVAAWRRRPRHNAAAHYSGRLGVPAIIPRRYWRALRGLDGDAGARGLLAASGRVTGVAMPEAAFDVDTRQDLAVLRRARPSRN